MAVPFIPEPEAEEQLRRIAQLLRESIDVLLQVLEQLPPQQPAPTVVRSRLPSCEEEDEDDEDEHQDPPPVASVAGVDGELELPDVVPRAAPRQSRPAPKWPASPYHKYITQAPPAPSSRRRVVESSDTTAMYRLPDLLEGHAPSAAPSSAPSESRRAYSPKPAPRRRRRPQTAAPKCASPSLSALPSEWLAGSEEELKTLSKMAEQAPTTCDYVELGHNLRRIADTFSQTLQPVDEVDGPAKLPPSTNFLSKLLPPPAVKTGIKGTFLTMMVLTVGWTLLSRSR